MKLKITPDYKNYNYMAALFFSDTAAYVLGILLSYETRLLFQEIFGIIRLQFTLSHLFAELWWIYVLYIGLNFFFGLYSRRTPFWKESREIVIASVMTFILSFAFISLGKMTEDFSRLTILFLWFYSCFFTLIFRYFLKTRLYKYGIFLENTVIIGNYEDAETIAESFVKEPYLGYDIIGVVPVSKGSRSGGKRKYRILGNIDYISRIIAKEKITAAVILPDVQEKYGMSILIGKLQIMLSKIIIMPSIRGLAFSNAEAFQTLTSRLSYFQINNNLRSFANRFIKRTIDILLALIALPFVLLISLIIGVFIKASSSGPVFYSHQRIGRNGRVIKILKFRSMYRDADKRLRDILKNDKKAALEWQKSFKLKNDPRITPIGKFLRKTSLDELPQIFNVLTGDMSMIGPRPVLKEELENYYKNFASYYMMVRPGITGLWQINGRSDTGYDFRVTMDTWYVLNWSIWLDMVILLKTPAAVFKEEGAY